MAILIGVPAADAVGFAVDAVAVQAATSATSGSAYLSFRKRERFTCGFSFVSGARCLAGWTSRGKGELVAGGGHGGGPAAAHPAESLFPEAEQAVRGDEHDREEDQADERVE